MYFEYGCGNRASGSRSTSLCDLQFMPLKILSLQSNRLEKFNKWLDFHVLPDNDLKVAKVVAVRLEVVIVAW